MKPTQQDFERIFKDHLKIETYSKPIDSLLSPRMLGKIDYSPYYQRNYVWDSRKASYFIESILLGTEIPPLVFFNNNRNIEVIDGRQRFETIVRFQQNKFALSKKGMRQLAALAKSTYDDLGKNKPKIIEYFLDTKIRIIEFALVNEPPLDKHLEDRIKKEIFSRYNTGITPLRRSEIDNANYDDDPISTEFKRILNLNLDLRRSLYQTFFKTQEKHEDKPPIEDLLSFIRRSLVLPKYPIQYYAMGHERSEILGKLYEYFSDSTPDEHDEIERFIAKAQAISKIRIFADDENLQCNSLALECFLWGLSVIENEGVSVNLAGEEFRRTAARYISENITHYVDQDYFYSAHIIDRFTTTARFFEERFNRNLGIYLTGSSEKKAELRELRQQEELDTKFTELETLRLNKPEPARNSILDIRSVMQRRRFLVRPSYQRQEVINPTKASSIIESILLGITLPALFIYKRDDGISEVVDGQQRILTILGYMGSEYVDESGNSVPSKNNKFSLRKPRVMTEISGMKYSELTQEQQDRILDFQLYIVEIEQSKNPNFNPIDLFIRLNDKPYPIRENSFEMWNSWVDFEIIDRLKDVTKRFNSWFFLRLIKRTSDRDRMENEELIASLSFFAYISAQPLDRRKLLDVYQRAGRINVRVGDKAYISKLLGELSENDQAKKDFMEAIKSTESFIRKLKYVLLDADITSDRLGDYLSVELDSILRGDREARYFKRTSQDLYMVWMFLGQINIEMVKFHRLAMKEQLREAFRYVKNIPESDYENNIAYDKFMSLVDAFKEQYRREDRKLRLSEVEKFALLKKQENLSSLTGAPIFLGDEIEPDHIVPLAIGGSDSIDNIGIAHAMENRSKGPRVPLEDQDSTPAPV